MEDDEQLLASTDDDPQAFGRFYARHERSVLGFLLKDAPPPDLLSAIRAVASGDAVIAPSTTRRLLTTIADRLPSERVADPRLAELTPREHEVLLTVARGLSNAEIAEELVLSEATVKTHVGRVLMKLELRDRVQIVVYAYDHGLVNGGPASV